MQTFYWTLLILLLTGGTYTNSSNYQQSRDNPRGGRGFRGGDRGDRGGRGRGGMSNGYSRGGGRGGDRNYSGKR